MSRIKFWSFWHSRLRLSILSISLALLLVAVNLFSEDTYDVWPQEKEEDQSSFSDDVDYALETLDYMHNLQTGKAPVRPVIETPKRVSAYWRCRLRLPQRIHSSGWLLSDNLYLFSATYDRRKNSLYPSNHIVQVLAMSYRGIVRNCFCNIYDENDQTSVVVAATVREIWQRAWDPRDRFYIPNLISCPLPEGFREKSDLAVSVAYSACQSTSEALRVRKNDIPEGGKRGVAVCIKGMDFLEDLSTRLVEWVEAQFLLGADHITLYTYYVPEKTEKVLNYYVAKKKLTSIPITLPGDSPNDILTRSRYIWRNRQQKRRHELLPYNDCFYRHIDTHNFILIVDTDELVVPLKAENWTEMLQAVIANYTEREITSISIRNLFKFPSKFPNQSFPEYMYMLRNRQRSEDINKPGDYGKSFTNTNTVATVFNHFALHRQHENVSRTIYAKADVALKLHYKQKCPIESRRDCPRYEKYTVEDTSLDRLASELTERVTTVLKELSML